MDDFDLFDGESTGGGAAELTHQSLVDTQQRLGSMLDALPIGLLIHTEQGILFANQEACRLLRSDKSRLVGQHFLDFVHCDSVPSLSAQFRRAFTSGGDTLNIECLIQPDSDSQRLVNLILGRLPWAGNSVIQILFRDITDQKRAEASLRQLTITDELTGAYNRRHAIYEAGLYIDQFESSGIPLSVLMIDIDHFKHINDTYGHVTGDTALIQLTRLANETILSLRDTDSAIFARIGGEEFAMLLPGIALERATVIAEKFRIAISSLKVPAENGAFSFTASIGAASFCSHDMDFAGLLRRADRALYEAKGSGRNRVVTAA